jgi:hypothetical protein
MKLGVFIALATLAFCSYLRVVPAAPIDYEVGDFAAHDFTQIDAEGLKVREDGLEYNMPRSLLLFNSISHWFLGIKGKKKTPKKGRGAKK